MGCLFDVLSEDDVLHITALVEKLERSRFDFLQLDVGDVRLTIGKGDAPPPVAVTPQARVGAVTSPDQTVAAGPAAAAAVQQAGLSTSQAVPDDGTVEITSPMVGRFYAKPEPDAASFVSVGSEVNADSTVGLIEMMKVFTAVHACRSGIVTEICVQDGDFVEYGQVLFRIRPER